MSGCHEPRTLTDTVLRIPDLLATLFGGIRSPDLPEIHLDFYQEQSGEALGLAYSWTALAIVAILVGSGVGGLSQHVPIPHVQTPVIRAIGFVLTFVASGVLLGGLRFDVLYLIIWRVKRRHREDWEEVLEQRAPGRRARWVLASSDWDVLVQLIPALIVAIAVPVNRP